MSRLAPFALLQTVFAIAAGAVFLHEPLTRTLVVGAAVCIAGVTISQSRQTVHDGPVASLDSISTIAGERS